MHSATQTVRERSKKFIASILSLADFGEFLFQGELVQLLYRQAHEQLDTPRQLLGGLPERCTPGCFALDMRRVGNPPMRRSWFAEPQRAGFARRVVAHGKNKIKLRRAGQGELVPAFAAQSCGAVPLLLQPLQCTRIDLPGRLAASATG